MRGLFFTLAVLSMAPASDAADRDWGAYGNNRYNFAICYPPGLRPQGEADSGDGQVFKGADGASLTVYGENLVMNSPIETDVNDLAKDAGGPGAKVSYRAGKANWRVVSGHGPKGEFYIKRVKRADQALTFILAYPARLHDAYAPVAAKVSACFTAGREAGE